MLRRDKESINEQGSGMREKEERRGEERDNKRKKNGDGGGARELAEQNEDYY